MIQRFEEFNRNIARAYKNLVSIKTAEMSRFGLKAANVMCLFFLGGKPEGLTSSELCSLCCEDKAGVSKSLAVLKEKGYVTVSGEGKYKQKYTATPAGLEIYGRVSNFIKSTVETVGGGYSDSEREIFYKVLDKIVSNLDAFSEKLKEEAL